MAHSSLGELDEQILVGTITLLIKDASDERQKKKKLDIKTWSTVKDVKDLLQQRLHVPLSRQRLFYRGRELRNAHSLITCGIFNDNQTLELEIAPEPGDDLFPFCRPFGDHCPRLLYKVVNQVQRALQLNIVPELAMEGTGGTYFMKDSRKRKIGCFKPQDEEPFMINNPRNFYPGNQGENLGMRPGVRAGEACIREVAAYLMDHKEFAGVPPTSLVFAQHSAFNYEDGNVQPKLGSFQQFVAHDECVGDLAPSKIPVREVHKIAILDLRLLNGDRNDANLLVRRRRRQSGTNPEATAYGENADQEIELIPIDHGYCLPDKVEIGWCDLCWLEWPQLKEPLDTATRRYVLKLDPAAEARRLGRKLDLRAPCLRNCQAAHMLLVEGVKAGLTLHQIANIVARQDLDIPSEFERLLDKAHELARLELYNAKILNHNNHHYRHKRVQIRSWKNGSSNQYRIQEELRLEDPVCVDERPFRQLSSESASSQEYALLGSPSPSPPKMSGAEFNHFMPGGSAPVDIPSVLELCPSSFEMPSQPETDRSGTPSPQGKGFWVREMSEIDDENEKRASKEINWNDEEDYSVPELRADPPGFLAVDTPPPPPSGLVSRSVSPPTCRRLQTAPEAPSVGLSLDESAGSSRNVSFASPSGTPGTSPRPLHRVASYSGFSSPTMLMPPPQLQPAPNGMFQQRNGRIVNEESKNYNPSFFNYVDILLRDLFNRHKNKEAI